ncbi:MAG: hypothetical protein IPI17_17840 [Nitrosomonas sp.]|nr:hypothetical protein [Nitrosomonas sp.]
MIGSETLAAFGAGMSGVGTAGASAGVFSAAGGAGTHIGGAGTALGGSGMGAAASMGLPSQRLQRPRGAAAGIALGSLIAGDKKIGPVTGTMSAAGGAVAGAAAGSMIVPGIGTAVGAVIGGVVGGLVNAFAGHGPYKFRQQSMQGTISAGGFAGDVTNVYRSEGGWVVAIDTSQFQTKSQEM